MTVKLLTEHHLEFLSLKGAARARLSLPCESATLLEITCRGSYGFFCTVTYMEDVIKRGVRTFECI